MSTSWEALPQRTRKRRSSTVPLKSTPPVSGMAQAREVTRTEALGSFAGRSDLYQITSEQVDNKPVGRDAGGVLTSGGGDASGGRGPPEGTQVGVQLGDEHGAGSPSGVKGLVQIGGETDPGSGAAGDESDAAAAQAARHALVASAVEERARMPRFSAGLEGGAGADGANFEYLDHTADVQLHSWGDSLEAAMEAALQALFNVITDIDKVEVNPSLTREVEVSGHDVMSLLFSLLDEFLFLFHAEGLAIRKATVRAVDREAWTLTAKAEGETFDLSKHPQGTEVKAITYSNMQVNEDPSGRTDIYVIVDI